MSRAMRAAVLLLVGVTSCSRRETAVERRASEALEAPAGDGASPGREGTPQQQAAELAARLQRRHFLIGMGNDLSEDHDRDGAYLLGPRVDVHYAYLVGVAGRGGWPDWNEEGGFVTVLAETARRHGVIPMFTLYAMAAAGEDNARVLSDHDFMARYLGGARLLFRRLGEFDDPAIVHIEPDFWGFMQKRRANPRQHQVVVEAHAPECRGLGDSLAGLGRCLVRMGRRLAPKTLLGFHASAWAHHDPRTVGDYLVEVGAREADLVVVEMLDRDAGCYEAGVDPSCARKDGPWYWDESNRTSPNFREHLEWARRLANRVRRPLLWWQLPFGVPSDAPGGRPGAYRDNRVKYVFEHVEEFVDVGGLGAAFGVGAAHQTYVTSDGGQFRRAVEAYRARPAALEATASGGRAPASPPASRVPPGPGRQRR